MGSGDVSTTAPAADESTAEEEKVKRLSTGEVDAVTARSTPAEESNNCSELDVRLSHGVVGDESLCLAGGEGANASVNALEEKSVAAAKFLARFLHRFFISLAYKLLALT
jgi:hypothetical protein